MLVVINVSPVPLQSIVRLHDAERTNLRIHSLTMCNHHQSFVSFEVKERRNLPLTLLLAWHDLESTRVKGRLLLLLLLLGASATFLSNLGPATACRLVLGRTGRVAVVDNALVRELAAAEKFLSEVTGVEGVAGGVDGLRDELGIGGEAQ